MKAESVPFFFFSFYYIWKISLLKWDNLCVYKDNSRKNDVFKDNVWRTISVKWTYSYRYSYRCAHGLSFHRNSRFVKSLKLLTSGRYIVKCTMTVIKFAQLVAFVWSKDTAEHIRRTLKKKHCKITTSFGQYWIRLVRQHWFI